MSKLTLTSKLIAPLFLAALLSGCIGSSDSGGNSNNSLTVNSTSETPVAVSGSTVTFTMNIGAGNSIEGFELSDKKQPLRASDVSPSEFSATGGLFSYSADLSTCKVGVPVISSCQAVFTAESPSTNTPKAFATVIFSNGEKLTSTIPAITPKPRGDDSLPTLALTTDDVELLSDGVTDITVTNSGNSAINALKLLIPASLRPLINKATSSPESHNQNLVASENLAPGDSFTFKLGLKLLNASELATVQQITQLIITSANARNDVTVSMASQDIPLGSDGPLTINGINATSTGNEVLTLENTTVSPITADVSNNNFKIGNNSTSGPSLSPECQLGGNTLTIAAGETCSLTFGIGTDAYGDAPQSIPYQVDGVTPPESPATGRFAIAPVNVTVNGTTSLQIPHQGQASTDFTFTNHGPTFDWQIPPASDNPFRIVVGSPTGQDATAQQAVFTTPSGSPDCEQNNQTRISAGNTCALGVEFKQPGTYYIVWNQGNTISTDPNDNQINATNALEASHGIVVTEAPPALTVTDAANTDPAMDRVVLAIDNPTGAATASVTQPTNLPSGITVDTVSGSNNCFSGGSPKSLSAGNSCYLYLAGDASALNVGASVTGNITLSYTQDGTQTKTIAVTLARNLYAVATSNNKPLIKFNGTSWSDITRTGLGNAPYYNILIANNGDITLAGTLDNQGTNSVEIKTFNGDSWSTPTAGNSAISTNPSLRELKENNGTLYAVGADPNVASFAKEFAGSSWADIASNGSPIAASSGFTNDISFNNTSAYVVGKDATTAFVKRSANGGAWSNIGGNQNPTHALRVGTNNNSTADAAAIDGTDLYVAGTIADTSFANHLFVAKAPVDGSGSWSGVGTDGDPMHGTPAPTAGNLASMRSMLVLSASNIYVAGAYNDNVASPTQAFVKHWDGSSWSPVSSDNGSPVGAVDSGVEQLLYVDNTLYAIGVERTSLPPKPFVKKLENGAWVTVGNQSNPFTPENGRGEVLAVGPELSFDSVTDH